MVFIYNLLLFRALTRGVIITTADKLHNNIIIKRVVR